MDVKALNEKGKPIQFRAGGLLARAVQHETDHLNGILFIDRMERKKKDELRDELDALQAATKAELKAYRDMIQTVRDRVAAGVAAGKSLEEIVASHPTQEFDKQYATDRVGGDVFVGMVYQSLTGKRMDWHPAKK